jgi:transposase
MPSSSSKSARVRALLASGMSPADIAKQVGCSTNLVYVVKSKSGGGKTKGLSRRGPGRPPKATTGMADLQGILAAVQVSERQRSAMRSALEKIQGIIAEALA